MRESIYTHIISYNIIHRDHSAQKSLIQYYTKFSKVYSPYEPPKMKRSTKSRFLGRLSNILGGVFKGFAFHLWCVWILILLVCVPQFIIWAWVKHQIVGVIVFVQPLLVNLQLLLIKLRSNNFHLLFQGKTSLSNPYAHGAGIFTNIYR